MLESQVILGVKHISGGYEHGIVTQSIERWPCGVPVVYPAGELERSRNTKATTLMSPSQVAAGRDSYNVPTTNIAAVDLKPLYKNHEVLEIAQFDISKFDRLMQFVRDVGGISLVIGNPEGRQTITKSVARFLGNWQLSSVFYYNGWGKQPLDGEDDHYLCILTLLDLPYCVPLFNMRKVDGVGLSFCGATRKASEYNGQLHRIFRADIVCSNYPENIFYIDGVEVNQKNPLGSDHYRQLTEMASQTLDISTSKKKKLVAHKAPEKYRTYREYSDPHEEKMKWEPEGGYAEAKKQFIVSSTYIDGTIQETKPVVEFASSVIESNIANVSVDNGTQNLWTTTVHGDLISFGEDAPTEIEPEEATIEEVIDDAPEEMTQNEDDLSDEDNEWLDAQDPEGN